MLKGSIFECSKLFWFALQIFCSGIFSHWFPMIISVLSPLFIQPLNNKKSEEIISLLLSPVWAASPVWPIYHTKCVLDWTIYSNTASRPALRGVFHKVWCFVVVVLLKRPIIYWYFQSLSPQTSHRFVSPFCISPHGLYDSLALHSFSSSLAYSPASCEVFQKRINRNSCFCVTAKC